VYKHYTHKGNHCQSHSTHKQPDWTLSKVFYNMKDHLPLQFLYSK